MSGGEQFQQRVKTVPGMNITRAHKVLQINMELSRKQPEANLEIFSAQCYLSMALILDSFF